MLKWIVGAVVIALILVLFLRRRNGKRHSKPWHKRLTDWLFARELAVDRERPPRPAGRPQRRARPAAAPHRAARTDPDQTQYIRPSAAPRPTEIALSYAADVDSPAYPIPVSKLPFRVGARADCDYVLGNDTISREHFELFRDAYGELCVRNLSRTNGIIPINEQSGLLDEPILEPGRVIPIDRETGTLRFWAGELFFTLALVPASTNRRRR